MKIFKIIIFIAFIIFSALAGHRVGAAEFSADLINKVKGRTFYSKIYMKANKIRLETQGQHNYSIMRMDQNVVWLVFPKDKVYMEMVPYEPQVPGRKLKGEISRKFIGSEIINEYETQKYEVTIVEEGKTTKVLQWIATQINYPIKVSAIDGSWSSEYKNLKIEPQPDKVFELPPGFEKMEMPFFTPGPAPEKR